MVVNMKVVHFDKVLDDMAMVDQVWFEEKSKPGGKVVNIL
jgi:hypothetical protein